jgi:hypothetical protein
MTSISKVNASSIFKRNKSYDHFSLLKLEIKKTNSHILKTTETSHSINLSKNKLKNTIDINKNEREIEKYKINNSLTTKTKILQSNLKLDSNRIIKKTETSNDLGNKKDIKNRSAYFSNKNSPIYFKNTNKDYSINYSVSTNLERSYSNKSITKSRRIFSKKENQDNFKSKEFYFENELDSMFINENDFEKKTNIYKTLKDSISILENKKEILDIEIQKCKKSSSENLNESIKVNFIKKRLESQSKFYHLEIIKIREESIKVE